ncbi:hypothetical protein E2C01_038459 [Portunus trituberculatus]|uniref:Uncharacterized protein n=1 Tax=Portunus trituberculatus TaxID=210409 RepID=A0A5B7FHZ8_PORTR|nr:hypothetical protein [Portunus trituberculatus]
MAPRSLPGTPDTQTASEYTPALRSSSVPPRQFQHTKHRRNYSSGAIMVLFALTVPTIMRSPCLASPHRATSSHFSLQGGLCNLLNETSFLTTPLT